MNNVLFETARSLRKLPAQEPVDSASWERLAIDLRASGVEDVVDRLTSADYLALLLADQQEILRLRYLEDLSFAEIASRLKISEGNARIRLFRALAAAKAIVGAGPKEDRP